MTALKVLPFSPVAAQVVRRAQDPDVTAAELGQMIGLSPTLAASLLKLANSPFYGLSRGVASVPQAVMILGVSATVRLVSCAALAEPLKAMDAALAHERWEHYVSTAVYARCLIEDDEGLAGLAFIAGLLCDIGEICLLQSHGRDYRELLVGCVDGHERQPLEAERFGQSHAVVGAELLQTWNLPTAFAEAARHHDAPQPVLTWSRVQQAVWVGDRLATGGTEREEALACRLKGLADPARAMEQGRLEVEALMQLVGG